MCQCHNIDCLSAQFLYINTKSCCFFVERGKNCIVLLVIDNHSCKYDSTITFVLGNDSFMQN